MKVSELIGQLGVQLPDHEVVVFVQGNPAQQVPIVGVGTLDPNNGEPKKVVIEVFKSDLASS